MDTDNIPAMDDAGFYPGKPMDTIIKVVGVGGGGCNAVEHMYKQNIENVSFVILNTDRQQLNASSVPQRVEIGNGLGAGNKPEIARKAAEDASDRISELFEDNTKMVFITGGMGGGTGTGAAPVVARIAKEKGLLTVGIVTIPFLFEGLNKIKKALLGVEEMGKYVDALLVINNQRLPDIYPDYSFVNAFDKADDTLTTAARSISELITSEGKINLDFNDVDTTLRNGGASIISTGYGEGEGRVTKAIEDALKSPLLRDTDIMTSKKLLFNLYFNPEAETPLMAGETDELTTFINGIDEEVDVIWGAAYDKSLGDKVKITILAAGFKLSVENGKKPATVSFGKGKKPDLIDEIDITKDYGQEAANKIRDDKVKSRFIVLTPSQMDDDMFIDALEKSPTFNRDKKVSTEIKSLGKSAQQPVSAQAEENRPNLQPRQGSGPAIRFGAD
ncbi:MAG: cell division protein FtsZ [Lachnospiraceae bacterium]|nr:cell division protein FtsZ [Lachnospiraceae bacterium]